MLDVLVKTTNGLEIRGVVKNKPYLSPGNALDREVVWGYFPEEEMQCGGQRKCTAEP